MVFGAPQSVGLQWKFVAANLGLAAWKAAVLHRAMPAALHKRDIQFSDNK